MTINRITNPTAQYQVGPAVGAAPEDALGAAIRSSPEVIKVAAILSNPLLLNMSFYIKCGPGDDMHLGVYLVLNVGGMHVELEPAVLGSVQDALLDWALREGGPAVPYVDALVERLAVAEESGGEAQSSLLRFKVEGAIRQLLGETDELEDLWEEGIPMVSSLDTDCPLTALIARLLNEFAEIDDSVVREILDERTVRQVMEW